MALSLESKLVIYWRKKRGVSKSELARRLGISPQAVSQWDSGVTSPRRRIQEIAEALGLTVSGFWGAQEAVQGGTDSQIAAANG